MKINILGVKIDSITQKEALRQFGDFLNSNQKHYIVTPNPEFIMAAQKDEEFKNILNSASLALPDGFGIKLAAKYLKTPIKERVTGVDFIWKVAKILQNDKTSIYFYGAEEGIAKKAAKRLARKYPKLNIVGTESGFRKGRQIANQDIIQDINRKHPRVLLVALGSPKQEKWIAQNLKKLNTVKVAMGVGGSFDYIAQKIPRAPKIMRILGLEWLFRLVIQPWRINRIVTATIRFSREVIKSKKRNG